MIFSWVLFGLYRYLVFPIVLWLLSISYPFCSKKVRQMLKDRQESRWPVCPGRPIIVHASSGEIEYAKSLIRKIKQEFPQSSIIVTYFSPSAVKLIESIPEINFFVPLPWDQAGQIKKLIEHFRPKLFLFARTDVWPELAYQLKKNQIPSVLFSATMDSKSSRFRGIGAILTRFSFSQLTEIFCVSEEDRLVCSRIGLSGSYPNIKVLGDTRWDQVLYRIMNSNRKWPIQLTNDNYIWVAGSTWPEDEEQLFTAFVLWVSHPKCQLIIVPHEFSEDLFLRLTKLFNEHGHKVKKWSSGGLFEEKVLVVDQVGWLAEIYPYSSLNFVGGSFKQKVHSVMEALIVGVPTIVGPYFQNNREASQFVQIPRSGLKSVHSRQEAESWVAQCQNEITLQPPKNISESKFNLLKPSPLVHSELGATERIFNEIQKYL